MNFTLVLFCISCQFFHFFGIGNGRVRQQIAAQKTGKFLYALGFFQNGNICSGLMIRLFFFYFKVLIRHGGNLGQVGNTNNLMISAQQRQFPGNLPCGPAADPCVNFIKNQCINGIFFSHNRFQTQHNT